MTLSSVIDRVLTMMMRHFKDRRWLYTYGSHKLSFSLAHSLSLSIYPPLVHSLIRSSLISFFHFTLFTTFLCFMLIVFFDCLPLFLCVYVHDIYKNFFVHFVRFFFFAIVAIVVVSVVALLSGCVRLFVCSSTIFSFIFIFRFSVDIIVRKPTDGI